MMLGAVLTEVLQTPVFSQGLPPVILTSARLGIQKKVHTGWSSLPCLSSRTDDMQRWLYMNTVANNADQTTQHEMSAQCHR
jgi:hypothetical protein